MRTSSDTLAAGFADNESWCDIALHAGKCGRAEALQDRPRHCRGGALGSAGIDGSKGAMSDSKDLFVGTAGRHGEFDATDADGDERPDPDAPTETPPLFKADNATL